MVLDTSAIVAILSNEPERERCVGLIGASASRRLSAANRVEATSVIEGRKRDAGRADAARGPRAAIRRYWLPNRSCSMPAAAKM
jgi:uncharacterized protein with PIN domain